MLIEIKCLRHPQYQARQVPKDCDTCHEIWRLANGLTANFTRKEIRARRRDA